MIADGLETGSNDNLNVNNLNVNNLNSESIEGFTTFNNLIDMNTIIFIIIILIIFLLCKNNQEK